MKKVSDFNTFKKLKSMSFNDFNRWLTSFYGTAFADGMEEAQKEAPPLFTDDEKLASCITDDRLYEVVLSVKGVGSILAERIVNAILEEGVSYKRGGGTK